MDTSSRSLRRLPVAAATLLLALAACGTTTDGAASSPATLAPAAPTSAPGTHRVTCALTLDRGRTVIGFDLPDDVRGVKSRPCAFTKAAPQRTAAPSSPTLIVVDVVDDDAPSLREEYADDEEFAVEDHEDFLGDDTLYDLELRTDVPVFGDTRGDVLSYECFCDGAPIIDRFARAGGIQLTWTSVPDVQAETDADLATALASLGTVSRAGG